MEISYVGSPIDLNLDNHPLTTSVRNTVSKMGKVVEIIDVPNTKMAKIILLILNWNLAQNNSQIKSVLDNHSNKIQLEKMLETLSEANIKKIPSSMIFNYKLVQQLCEAISEERLNIVLKQESSISIQVSEMIGSEEPKIVEEISVRKPTSYAKIITCYGESMTSVLLAVETRKKVQIQDQVVEEEIVDRSDPHAKRVKGGVSVWVKVLVWTLVIVGLGWLQSKYRLDREISSWIENMGSPAPVSNSTAIINVDPKQNEQKKQQIEKKKPKQNNPKKNKSTKNTKKSTEIAPVQESKEKKQKKGKQTKQQPKKGTPAKLQKK